MKGSGSKQCSLSEVVVSWIHRLSIDSGRDRRIAGQILHLISAAAAAAAAAKHGAHGSSQCDKWRVFSDGMPVAQVPTDRHNVLHAPAPAPCTAAARRHGLTTSPSIHHLLLLLLLLCHVHLPSVIIY